jgi:phosphoribosylformimino-5-aminoimidazole carboxamide ribotide isomerase
MRFRPCIDLHAGMVKQIVGSTYRDADDSAMVTNFATATTPSFFAELYRNDGLAGGHIIMLGKGNDEAARRALAAWPGGMQVGGGITPENASAWIDAGASAVIMTSYVFRDGVVDWEHLEHAARAVGRGRLVLDISCKRVGGAWLVVTDRWQKVSATAIDAALLDRLSRSCGEFLVHAADVEGRQAGIAGDLVALLASAAKIPVTYAGGIRSLEDLETVADLGNGRIDATIGSALDIFGGNLAYRDVVAWSRKRNPATSSPAE